MNQTGYICSGTCKAFVTQEQYDSGITECGAEVCTLKHKPFIKGFKCKVCNDVFAEGKEHKHE